MLRRKPTNISGAELMLTEHWLTWRNVGRRGVRLLIVHRNAWIQLRGDIDYWAGTICLKTQQFPPPAPPPPLYFLTLVPSTHEKDRKYVYFDLTTKTRGKTRLRRGQPFICFRYKTFLAEKEWGGGSRLRTQALTLQCVFMRRDRTNEAGKRFVPKVVCAPNPR